jgi:hypothetical protein
MPQRASNAFDRLAPDQRAAVELVLRGRSYAELGELLGIPASVVRERARGGLEALAPDLPPPARVAEVADWLLGQGGDVRALLRDDAGTRRWAETVAAPLREVAGAKVPALPGDEPPAEAAPPRDAPSLPAASPRDAPSSPPAAPPRAASPPPAIVEPPSPAVTPEPVIPPPAAPTEPPAAGGSPGRSSRLGGFILIGVAVVVVVAVLAFVLTRGGDDNTPAAAAPTPTPSATATATGTPAASANDIVLRGPAGSKAVGLMRLFKANDDTVRFALAAQDVAPNTGKDTYSIWFTKADGTGIRLGVAQDQVGSDGTLTTAGPRNEDVKKFPQWFATYDHVLVTQDSSPTASKPGKVVLSGDLPNASG